MSRQTSGDGARFIRDHHRDLSRSLTFTTAYTGTAPFLTVPGAKYTIYVQRISVAISTDAAQSMTFKDTAGTPVVIAGVKTSPGVGPVVYDFGDEGVPLTEGKNFDVAVSGAGLAGSLEIHAYAKLTPGKTGVVPSDL